MDRDTATRGSRACPASAHAVGLILALASSRLLAGQLFQVHPADSVSLGAACFLLGVVAVSAAYLPARRATRVDPTIALRAE